MDSNFNFNEDNKQFKLMENQDEKGTFYRPKWELKPKGQPHPARRWCHTATNHDKFLYILGGRLAESAKIKQFAYKINCETFAYEQIQLSDNLMMRESHSCSLIGDSLYVLFGMKKSEKVLNDCLQLKLSPNGIIWHKKVLKPEIDSRESHMSLVLDERYILIYGGMDGEEKLIQNFYIYDTEKEIWKHVLNLTGAVQVKVGGTLINIKNQIYLFGGQINDQNQYSNQIYKIQIRNYTHNDKDLKPEISITKLNVLGQRPMPRSQFASVAFKDRYLLVLGGEGPIKDKSQFPTLLSDIWSFDTERMVWEEIIPENPSVFKPRSSFTATIYKDNLIVFGGLVSFKDYRTTDEMLVLNLNTQVQKRPICSLCKSSYKVIPKEQVEVTNSRATLSLNNFSTGISLVLAISKTIEHPFTALCSLLHSFVPFQIEKCFFSLREQKLCMNLKKFEISQNEWSHILNSYEFTPLIQQRDPRVNNALKHEIRHNMVNYLAYNLKNSCFRLGGQLLISRISNKNELQMCLMNKFGIYHTQNISSQGKYNPSATSIILQYLKQHEIQLSQLFQNSLTICITSLKTENSTSDKKQIIFDLTSRDIICQDNFKFKNFMEIGFSKNLPFKLALSNQQSSFIEEEKFFDIKPNRLWESKQDQEDKWPQENLYPDIFQDIFTYEAMAGSVILVYQNNKLMHKTQLKKSSGTVYEFHLTKNIQPNLTFSDIIPTDRLLNAIKAVVKGLNTPVVKALKREKPCERQQLIQNCGASPGKGEYWEHPTKAVKTNEPENCDNSMEIQGAVRQDGEC